MVWYIIGIVYGVGYIACVIVDFCMRWHDYTKSHNGINKWYIGYKRPKLCDSLLVGFLWPVILVCALYHWLVTME